MAEWEITLKPDEVAKALEKYARAEYGIEGDIEIEAVNEWPFITIKMGEYPPGSVKSSSDLEKS